jgi:5-oxoprolinase (ATP-hydrolysing)
VFDFHGTGPQQKSGNCNAPRAVTLSALIYCLRCMVGYDVPLNQVLSTFLLLSYMHVQG